MTKEPIMIKKQPRSRHDADLIAASFNRRQLPPFIGLLLVPSPRLLLFLAAGGMALANPKPSDSLLPVFQPLTAAAKRRITPALPP